MHPFFLKNLLKLRFNAILPWNKSKTRMHRNITLLTLRCLIRALLCWLMCSVRRKCLQNRELTPKYRRKMGIFYGREIKKSSFLVNLSLLIMGQRCKFTNGFLWRLQSVRMRIWCPIGKVMRHPPFWSDKYAWVTTAKSCLAGRPSVTLRRKFGNLMFPRVNLQFRLVIFVRILSL